MRANGVWYTTFTPTILRLRSRQALGSTSLATDASGAEVTNSRTLYYPYGGVRWPTGGSTLPTDFTFTGQRNEAGIGLMDYHARFYDAALGRFISADTIVPNAANPQDLNRYAYVRNSPLNYLDPSGHALDSGMGTIWDERPPDEDPSDDWHSCARWNRQRAFYARVTWGAGHPAIAAHTEEANLAMLNYTAHYGGIPPKVFAHLLYGALTEMGTKPIFRTLKIE